MAKRNNKLNHAAHIKRRTEGTSNELSFSVLDAAKNAQLNGGEDELPLVGEVSLFTLSGKKSRKKGFYDGRAVMSAFPHGNKKTRSQKAKSDELVTSEASQNFDNTNTVGATSLHTPEGATAHVSGIIGSKRPAKTTKRYASFDEEIARRKKRRRIRSMTAILVIVIISVALIATGTGYLYKSQQTEQGYVQNLSDAISLLTETDNVMLNLDDELQDPFESITDEKLTAIKQSTEEIAPTLKEAGELAKSASANLVNTNDQDVANQTVSAVSARESMISYGLEILTEANRSKSAAQQMMDGWYAVAQADEDARAAAVLIEDPTTENIQASMEQTTIAIESLNQAKQLISQAQQNYPAVNRETYINYIDKRTEALGYALASDQALLDRNKEEAQAQNDAYNQADGQAAELAQNLDEDPVSVYEEAFDQAIQQTSEAFEAAKTQAGASDAVIRDYLGKQTK
ncbi:hypothetical protein AALA21_00365 [Eggerthellaceae bacterium 3-80]